MVEIVRYFAVEIKKIYWLMQVCRVMFVGCVFIKICKFQIACFTVCLDQVVMGLWLWFIAYWELLLSMFKNYEDITILGLILQVTLWSFVLHCIHIYWLNKHISTRPWVRIAIWLTIDSFFDNSIHLNTAHSYYVAKCWYGYT